MSMAYTTAKEDDFGRRGNPAHDADHQDDRHQQGRERQQGELGPLAPRHRRTPRPSFYSRPE